MEWQGKIDFQKPITINGKPHGIEHLATIPVWTSEDHGRIVHTENDDRLYIGTSSNWFEMLHSVEAHNHDNMYYTETEINGFFNGIGASGKLQVAWSDISNKPLQFDPVTHYHSEYFLEANVTFEAFNIKGLMGEGANKFAIGNHTHIGVYAPAQHDHPYVATIDFDNAFSGSDSKTGKKLVHWDDITGKEEHLTFAQEVHLHDDRYFTEDEIKDLYVSKATMSSYDSGIQTTFGNYYTITETDDLLNLKSDETHHHDDTYSLKDHDHDGDYAPFDHNQLASTITFNPDLTPFSSATTTVNSALKELVLMKFSNKNEIYVNPNYNASNNKSRNPDGTIDAPYLDITAAINSIGGNNYNSDVIIHVAPKSGGYDSSITLPPNVSLIGESGVKVNNEIITGTGICFIKNIEAKSIRIGGNTTLENVTITSLDSAHGVFITGVAKIVCSTIEVPITSNLGSLIIDNCIINVSGTGIMADSNTISVLILNSMIGSEVGAGMPMLDLEASYNIIDNCIIKASNSSSSDIPIAINIKKGSISSNKLSSCTISGDINISPGVGISIAGLTHELGVVYEPTEHQIKWDLPPESYRSEILERSQEYGGLTIEIEDFKNLKNPSLPEFKEDQNYFISTKETI
jgi:hypothetical protein